MNNNFNRNCLYVTGFNKDIDRKTLLTEFRKFGDIRKLYLDPLGEFSQVIFVDKQSADTAVIALQNSNLNWQVNFDRPSHNKMAHYDDYEDDDFSENFDYCNIHGQPLVVLQADSGDLYVNLKDVRKTGFALFRRDTFDSVLVDHRQIGTEFELHLLSEAKNYILKNRVASIDEDQILKTIERCKNKLLGGNTTNNFGPGRSVSQSSKSLTITSNIQQHDAGPPMVEHVPQRPPKILPNNFVPTQVLRADRSRGPSTQNQQQSSRGRRDNARYNGVRGPNSSPKTEDNLNSSSSSDTKEARRSGGYESGNKSQRSPKERKEEIGKVSFEIKSTYDVTVSFKEEKENICWVQDKRYASELEEVIIKVNELADELEPINNPFQGQFVIAEYEGMWNRGRVFNVEPLIVSFVDYGNRGTVNLVKAFPDSLRGIPMLANRIAIDINDISQPVKEDMDLKIFIKQKYDKGTYVVSLVDNKQKINKENVSSKPTERSSSISKNVPDVLCEKPPPVEEPVETPKQKSYCVIPKLSTDLQNGDMVMVVDVSANKFLVRTRECALKSKALTDYIRSLDKQPLPNVKVGQLVLSSKDGVVGLFRAVVVKKDNDLIVTVKYVDFPGEAELSIKSLRNVDDFLADEPATILITPEFKSLENVDEKAAEYISTICQNKEKFKVILSKDNFDLQATDGTLLSQTLKSFITPKLVPVKTPTVAASTSKEPVKTEEVKPVAVTNDKVLYDEMDWIKIEPGSYSFMCYWLQDVDDITFLSSTDDVIGYLETITAMNPTDQDPYKPDASEMCLVSYKGPEDDEASWYRAVMLSEDGGEYLVNFVDFGNIESVKSENIRRFPTYLKDIPILGIGCSCTGLPRNQQIVDRMKELIPEGTQVEVVVKELVDLKYQVEMPEIYKQLKAEKLF